MQHYCGTLEHAYLRFVVVVCPCSELDVAVGVGVAVLARAGITGMVDIIVRVGAT